MLMATMTPNTILMTQPTKELLSIVKLTSRKRWDLSPLDLT